MPAYFIADITIHDPDRYQDYLKGFMKIFDRHGGKLRVVSAAPVETIEGTWTPKGLVLMEFPSMEQAKAWKDDPDYIELSKIRKATAETQMVLVEGV